jgi:hypothetical protein
VVPVLRAGSLRKNCSSGAGLAEENWPGLFAFCTPASAHLASVLQAGLRPDRRPSPAQTIDGDHQSLTVPLTIVGARDRDSSACAIGLAAIPIAIAAEQSLSQ